MDNRDKTGHQRVKTDHDPVKLNHSRHNSPGVGDDGSRESSTDRTSQHHGRRDGSTELRASRQGSREHRADSMESRASHHLQPRSTVGAPTTISQDLRSTVTVVGPGLRSTVVTSRRSLRSTTKTIGQVPENTVVTAETDHRSTTMAVAPDPWNTVVTNPSFQVSSGWGGDYLPSANAGDW